MLKHGYNLKKDTSGMIQKNTVTLTGEHLSLAEGEIIARGAPVLIESKSLEKVQASRNYIKDLNTINTAVYGVNTGFGFLAQEKIAPNELEELQLNLLKSHAAGYGPPLSIPQTRLAMALRLNVLLKGHSGTSGRLCKKLAEFINKKIHPVIPSYGSVGASGDLAPLAHLALPLTGHGFVHDGDIQRPALEVLKEKNITPHTLEIKEGLTLINGTQVMGAIGGLAIAEGFRLLEIADQITALSFEGLGAAPSVLDPKIHLARGQKGQILSASRIRKNLEGSYLYKNNHKPSRVQDPYSLRCAPQVHGSTNDTLFYAVEIIEREFNAATDNPLVFCKDKQILSGGNFHGQPLALIYDFSAIALAEIASISERRLELLLNPHFSHLNAFLSKKPGLHSGYMAAQYLSASLVNENKILSHPASTDSIPGNIGIEDHVSMGMTSARKLVTITEHLKTVLAIELLAAAQAVDLRKSTPLGKGSSKLYKALRKKVPTLEGDRMVSVEIDQARTVLSNLLSNVKESAEINSELAYT
jgi:histidine ammonia-lyase